MADYLYISDKNSQDDKGAFASQDLPADLQLLKIDGKIISFLETKALGDKESFTLQIDEDHYIALHFPFFLVNHSCNPNCAVTPELIFKTIRPIKKGEELRWDYSTSMLERSWTIVCNCGESNCRKKIDDFDTLPISQQQFYLQNNLVTQYIANKFKGQF